MNGKLVVVSVIALLIGGLRPGLSSLVTARQVAEAIRLLFFDPLTGPPSWSCEGGRFSTEQ